MTRTSLKTGFILITTYLFILLFVYAAVSKLIDFDTFETQLGQSPLLSAYAQWVALLVPVAEILIAGLLCFPMFRSLGLYGFYVLMVMFTTYIIIILNFTSFTPCSCGGVLEDLGWIEHLIFNSVFIVLSGVSLFIYTSNKRKTLVKLTVLTLVGITIVTGIFLSSEKQIKRNNAFIRRYMPHALEKLGEYQLPSNAFYLAGMDNATVYLGNYNAPLYIMSIDTSLTKTNESRIAIDSLHLPYRKVRISVKPPHFFLGDGTVPVMFRGRIDEYNPKVFSYYDAYFTEFIIADSLNIGVITKSIKSKYNALGQLKKTKDSISFKMNEDILTRHSAMGTFDSDGTILWNDEHKRFVYVYFYRNSYEVADGNLLYQHTGKTIDTISKPKLDIAHYKTSNQYKLSKSSIIVNKQTTTDGDYLYVHSDRLGRFEGEEALRSASIIDVYDITDNTYAFSFYLYHQRDKKLSEFRVYKDLLVAIVDDKLWLYRLKDNYFKVNP